MEKATTSEWRGSVESNDIKINRFDGGATPPPPPPPPLLPILLDRFHGALHELVPVSGQLVPLASRGWLILHASYRLLQLPERDGAAVANRVDGGRRD